MMGSLFDIQMALDWALNHALVAALPPTWQAARMDLLPRADAVGKVLIVISSPEGHAQSLVPSADLIDGAARLAATFSDRALSWNRVSYMASRDAHGEWRFDTEYDY